MNPNQKYFNVLGISPTSDKNVIKKAYRKKAFQFHPDKNSSSDAQAKFIEITDAYEIVIGVKKKPSETSNGQSSPPVPSKEERVQAAKERFQRAKQKEEEANATFYLKLVEGKKWKLVKWIAILCCLLSLLLVVDYYLPSNVNSQMINEMNIENSYAHIFLTIDASTYYFNYEDAIQIAEYPMIDVVKTPIFNDLKSISLLTNLGTRIQIEPVFTLMYIFPLFPLILLVPLFTLWYKRPDPLFTLLHMISLYFIPLFFCFTIFSNWRIFQIFM